MPVSKEELDETALSESEEEYCQIVQQREDCGVCGAEFNLETGEAAAALTGEVRRTRIG